MFRWCLLWGCLCYSKVVLASLDSLLDSVSIDTGVPKEIINAVCTHESQSFHEGKRQPWPWTLNIKGKGVWFKNKISAVTFAELELMSGTKPINIDVGMCQINWHWHRDRFNSISELMEPRVNIRYAANHLKKLKKGNSWKFAIGAYHSPSNKNRAKKYASQVLSSL